MQSHHFQRQFLIQQTLLSFQENVLAYLKGNERPDVNKHASHEQVSEKRVEEQSVCGITMAGWTLGIETTAHTLSFGLVDGEESLSQLASDTLRPDQGGIHPREAADHHKDVASKLFQTVLEQHNLGIEDISAVAYSQGPGLGPCLRVGAAVLRGLATRMDVPLIGVNHCVAHIEIDGNNVVATTLSCSTFPEEIHRSLHDLRPISYWAKHWTSALGTCWTSLHATKAFVPGGPKIEQLANEYLAENPNPDMEGLQLPYAVRGMDLAFSGLLTAAQRLIDNGAPLNAVCWSLQEHAFASCVEVAERAMAHTGKTELLLGGGVACNQRIRTMCEEMSSDREGASLHPTDVLH